MANLMLSVIYLQSSSEPLIHERQREGIVAKQSAYWGRASAQIQAVLS
ncbi:MAG: hypothetical protein CSYNP_04255 [Syntrophus sp. SKADARSKE-3]|nr:hypothetical protein [Syntrophus sp. SKADARSKE-3]